MNTKTCPAGDLKAGESGELVATFSTFDVPDRDGDVTLRSAFQDGQPVPMVWSHDWSKIIGKGVIRVKADRAQFEGAFFSTQAGQEARETVRQLGPLAQYSYGFQIKDAAPGSYQGRPVRILKSVEIFEVSPVLVGAGVNTRTERLKQGPPRRSAAELRDRIGVLQAAIWLEEQRRLKLMRAGRLDLVKPWLRPRPPAATNAAERFYVGARS